jgi:hypothetical protein
LYQVLVAFKEFKVYKVELVYKVLVDYREFKVPRELKVFKDVRVQLELVPKELQVAKVQLVQVLKAQQVPKVFRAYRVVA